MNLLWYEIKLSLIDLKRGKDSELQAEMIKLHKILNKLNGFTLYYGKHSKYSGQIYYLSTPDNQIGKNLTQYLKLKKYSTCNEPQWSEIKFLCGSLLIRNSDNNNALPFYSDFLHMN
jgi:hypothetical protein